MREILLHVKASIILVYTYGFLTLMSRALMGSEKNLTLEGIVQLFPFVPALEVSGSCKTQTID